MTGKYQSTQKKTCLCHFIHQKSHRLAWDRIWPNSETVPHHQKLETLLPFLYFRYISTHWSNSTQRFKAIETGMYKHLVCANQQYYSTKHNNYPICLQMSLVSKSGPKPRSRSPPKYVTYSLEGSKPYRPTKRSQASSHDSFCITVPKTITATVTHCEIHTPQHRHCPTYIIP
jgi:hypothetical protein